MYTIDTLGKTHAITWSSKHVVGHRSRFLYMTCFWLE